MEGVVSDMSAEIIDKTGQATRSVKIALAELTDKIAAIDTSCNAFGVLNDPGMVLADLDQIFRAVCHIQTGIINTQWPKVAEYSEV